MTLLQNFYNVVQADYSPNAVQGAIGFNKQHEIFSGHFPSQPIVPGVCMIQIIRELTQRAVNQKLRLAGSDNIKFLAVIDPIRHPQIRVSIEIVHRENEFAVNASLHAGEVIFFKIKATFRPE
jgi:3-hydroxyacyl-[acyl-carrier-protein] dehydratase